MGRWYNRADNAIAFGSKRYRYFFDVPVSEEVCAWWHGIGNADTGWIHPNIDAMCQQLTEQKAWNDYTRYARWGWLHVNLDCDPDRMCVLPFITSHFRFAFVRRRDALLFKLLMRL